MLTHITIRGRWTMKENDLVTAPAVSTDHIAENAPQPRKLSRVTANYKLNEDDEETYRPHNLKT
ncbi:hypothetical protein BGZ93_003790 [Podila epicladia]|nr:hypothetical protein BGZ92_006885 [Podila epicladia]KAG0096907.1 hypothetical protein BGZ93_003790 [Podila epicladia]